MPLASLDGTVCTACHTRVEPYSTCYWQCACTRINRYGDEEVLPASWLPPATPSEEP